jgi:hypothetical protein
VAYELNGKEVTTPPYDAQGYADAKPVYIEMPGWKTSTIGTDAFDNLPQLEGIGLSYFFDSLFWCGSLIMKPLLVN